ncbi:MAG: hypothetical protein ACOYUZ_04545 [Patescibacteria group bacterium]
MEAAQSGALTGTNDQNISYPAPAIGSGLAIFGQVHRRFLPLAKGIGTEEQRKNYEKAMDYLDTLAITCHCGGPECTQPTMYVLDYICKVFRDLQFLMEEHDKLQKSVEAGRAARNQQVERIERAEATCEKYRARVQALEAASVRHKRTHENYKTERKETKAKMEEQSQELQELRAELESLRLERDAAAAEADSAKQSLAELQSHIAELEEAATAPSADGERIKELEAELAAAMGEWQQSDSRRTEAEADLEAMRGTHTNCVTLEVHTRLKDSFEQVRGQRDDARAAVKPLQAKLGEAISRSTELEKRIAEMEANREQVFGRRLAELNNRLKAAEEQRDQLAAGCRNLGEQKSEAEARVQVAEQSLGELQTQLADAQASLEQSRAQAASLQAKLDAANEDNNEIVQKRFKELYDEIAAANERNANLNARIQELVAEHGKVKNFLNIHLEAERANVASEHKKLMELQERYDELLEQVTAPVPSPDSALQAELASLKERFHAAEIESQTREGLLQTIIAELKTKAELLSIRSAAAESSALSELIRQLRDECTVAEEALAAEKSKSAALAEERDLWTARFNELQSKPPSAADSPEFEARALIAALNQHVERLECRLSDIPPNSGPPSIRVGSVERRTIDEAIKTWSEFQTELSRSLSKTQSAIKEIKGEIASVEDSISIADDKSEPTGELQDELAELGQELSEWSSYSERLSTLLQKADEILFGLQQHIHAMDVIDAGLDRSRLTLPEIPLSPDELDDEHDDRNDKHNPETSAAVKPRIISAITGNPGQYQKRLQETARQNNCEPQDVLIACIYEFFPSGQKAVPYKQVMQRANSAGILSLFNEDMDSMGRYWREYGYRYESSVSRRWLKYAGRAGAQSHKYVRNNVELPWDVREVIPENILQLCISLFEKTS